MSALAAPVSALPAPAAILADAAAAPRSSLWRSIVDWCATARAYFAAAALYEELNRLSDAELARRGLARDRLAQDACDAALR